MNQQLPQPATATEMYLAAILSRLEQLAQLGGAPQQADDDTVKLREPAELPKQAKKK